MSNAGFDFSVLKIDFDEEIPEGISDEESAIYLAEQKAAQIKADMIKGKVIITADTIVCLGDNILGKPLDNNDAYQMLKKLSNKTHKVLTGVCILSEQGKSSFVSSTEVRFSELTEEEIIYYIDNYKPFDKAGSYGIQEWIGYIGVEAISGSYFNVMGLPVQRLYCELNKFLNLY